MRGACISGAMLLAPPYRYLMHADWSVRATGRWQATAVHGPGGWRIAPSARVGDPTRLLAEIVEAAGAGPALLGVDLPIGAPRAWAAGAGVSQFIEAAAAFGAPPWAKFFEPATSPEEISRWRPFYPARPGGTRQRHLTAGIGVENMAALRRRCDFDANGRPAATPLFWTLGAAQVGKAAIAFWRDVLQPALRADAVAVWPFHGRLATLATPGRVVVAETYPAEAYGWFDLSVRLPGRSKRRVEDRAADAGRLLAAGRSLGAGFTDAATADIEAGFPLGGDDAFDALVGLLALVAVVEGVRPEGVPDDPAVETVEGWILGRRPGDIGGGPGRVE